jgi:hypothetical protein
VSPEKVLCVEEFELEALGDPDEHPAASTPVIVATTSSRPYFQRRTGGFMPATIRADPATLRDAGANSR